MNKNNKYRNRHLIPATFNVDDKRFRFRENRKNVFNSTRKKIRDTYFSIDDLN